jgi:sporulation protein YlmC with PRC-barrel domain
MSRTAMTMILAATMAAAAPAAYSQIAPTPSTATTTVVEQHMQGNQIRASKFIGSTVYDVQNRNIGKVTDLLFDRSGRVDAAVLDVGEFLGIGGKYIAVPVNDIKTDNNRLTVDMTKEQLQSAQAFRFNDTNSIGSSTQR